ncbi:hypothetical protein [Sphingomonas sp. RIT328]|uniref:hypothetical protein n=1 Tax=Sphingomonas sp. RIT328 TaxID=1470591 RepID=UPI000450E3E0|nr:hypothetical protein [Sphingomonas sp. RIT328]EZP57238.1 hypothetical protein BW41_00081 [Sphingomonas sp. RIT328]
MQHATLTRDADAPSGLITDFHIDKEPPVARRLIPHTLSRHMADRPIGRLPMVLADPDPTAARLKAVVARARGRSPGHPIHCGSGAQRLSSRIDEKLAGLTAAAIAIYAGTPVAFAMLAGCL